MAYVLRFFFDPGSGICFWAGNGEAWERFGYPVDLSMLPLTPPTRAAAEELIRRFDESIDWNDPASRGPWTPYDEEAFVASARAVLQRMAGELGPQFEIRDELEPPPSHEGEIVRLTLLESAEQPPAGMTAGQSFDVRLRRSTPLVIGRTPDADFRVVSATVGMRAVRLTLGMTGIWLEDLGSGGGSAVTIGGVTTSRPRCYLEDGAILRVGGVLFLVNLPRNG